ncbi:MAG: type III polyketide synthase [Acidobacteriota bacterium]
MRIASIGTAFPPHYYDQDTLMKAIRVLVVDHDRSLARLEKLHRHLLVGGRHLALPLEDYARLATWGDANDAWIRVSAEIGEASLRQALDRAGLGTDDLDLLIFISVTGVATPSIDAHLMNRLNMPARVKRMPLFGLGCVGGAAGLARAADYVKAYPDHVAAVVSVELCSLTLRRDDSSVANLIATGLFGDGSATVLVAGASRRAAGPRILDSRSTFYPGSEDAMGWRISEKGFGVILSAGVPGLVRDHIGEDVDRFLGDHGLRRRDMAAWICHPGGPKVLQAFQEALDLPRQALDLAWSTLAQVGNLSSASVLLVLDKVLEAGPPAPGAHALLVAMGPGFCSELVLLRW